MRRRHLLPALGAAIATLTVAAQNSKVAAPAPDVLVRDLYKAHDAQKGPFHERENRALAERYFTKELARLIAKDAVASKGEVGAYEFDPLYASQDPEPKGFKISEVQGSVKSDAAARDEAVAFVAVSFKERGEQRKLRFQLKRQSDETWRIADIHYSDGTSLLQLLRNAYATNVDKS